MLSVTAEEHQMEQIKSTIESARKILISQGLGTVLALGLVFWLAYTVTSKLEQIVVKQDTMNQILLSHEQETAFYLRQTCFNTAQTESQRASCIR